MGKKTNRIKARNIRDNKVLEMALIIIMMIIKIELKSRKILILEVNNNNNSSKLINLQMMIYQWGFQEGSDSHHNHLINKSLIHNWQLLKLIIWFHSLEMKILGEEELLLRKVNHREADSDLLMSKRLSQLMWRNLIDKYREIMRLKIIGGNKRLSRC